MCPPELHPIFESGCNAGRLLEFTSPASLPETFVPIDNSAYNPDTSYSFGYFVFGWYMPQFSDRDRVYFVKPIADAYSSSLWHAPYAPRPGAPRRAKHHPQNQNEKI